MTASQKRDAKYREQNLQAAHRILADPQYTPGSLMHRWATNYLNRKPDSIRAELEKRALGTKRGNQP
jgi:hypothetical protein